MVFVGLFLKSIFIVIMLCAFFFIGMMVYLLMKVKRVARHFGASQCGASRQGAGDSSASAGRGSAASGTGSDSTSGTYEEIYDARSEHVANRKIISKDEGEYVDFEEEKQ